MGLKLEKLKGKKGKESAGQEEEEDQVEEENAGLLFIRNNLNLPVAHNIYISNIFLLFRHIEASCKI